MNCYHCDKTLASGQTQWAEYGLRKVIVHKTCERADLIVQAQQLGCFTEYDDISDQRLIDAIAAEKLSGEWLDRMEKLPTNEAKAEAIHRLRLAFDEAAE